MIFSCQINVKLTLRFCQNNPQAAICQRIKKKSVFFSAESDITNNHLYLYMFSEKRNTRLFLLAAASCLSLFVLQAVWLCRTYHLEKQALALSVEKAFESAYRKEQTYRIPVMDIVNSGAVTIEGCGNEEVYIVRSCPKPDTIVYNNLSGHSIDRFIHRVFSDLREQIVPMNIHCMADLFSGLLHDAEISVVFVIERIDAHTGNVLETSLLPDRKQPDARQSEIINMAISDAESLRGIVQLTPGAVLGRMRGLLLVSICLAMIIATGLVLIYRSSMPAKTIAGMEEENAKPTEQIPSQGFRIGQYDFDPGKNELTGFNETIQLNKKENAILYSLCRQQGNVVERNLLLHENWGSSGQVYSRSLDTYLAALRKHLKKDDSIQIVTVKGVGYKLVVCLP